MTRSDVYHVIVNLNLSEQVPRAAGDGRGEEWVRELVQSRLEETGLSVSRISVYRGVENG